MFAASATLSIRFRLIIEAEFGALVSFCEERFCHFERTLVGLNLGRLGTVPVNPTPNQVFQLPNLLKVTANQHCHCR